MKIVIAPDSFKGSLSSKEVAHIIGLKAKENFPHAEVIEVPIADGGEGTLDAIYNNLVAKEISLEVTGPDFKKIKASYLMEGDTAYIELARESGLCISSSRSACLTTTKGFGEAIRDAVSKGAKKLYLAIGGSATNDGGMGMLTALGVEFFDKNGNILEGKGENLGKIQCIQLGRFFEKFSNVSFNMICDVSNPLLGEKGATLTYGPQKGASGNELIALEKGMENFADVTMKLLGKDYTNHPGAGAAGGVGFALLAYLDGKFCPGIDTVLDIVNFDEKVKGASLVITGEGKMDGQSAFGKAPVGVSMRSGGASVIALVGAIGKGFEAVYDKGITSVFSVYSDAVTLEYAMQNASEMLLSAADRMFRTIKTGYDMKEKGDAI